MKLEDISRIKPLRDFYDHSYISLKNKYLFHSIGKSANSTVKHFLYLIEYQGTRYKTKSLHDRQSSPCLSPFQLSNELYEEVFFSKDYFRFTFVRNPYTRLLSCYLDRIIPKVSAPYRQLISVTDKEIGYDFSFKEFIEIICQQEPYDQNNHWRLQFDDSCAKLIPYTYIGKQETFAENMEFVWSKIARGIKVPDFKNTNKSPSKTNSKNKLKQYWTGEIADLVATTYKDDFEYFGYSKEIKHIYN